MTTTSSTTATTATTTTAATTASGTSTSNSSIGSSIITSLDVGSGIDTDSLVTKLTAVQKTTLEGAITTKQAANAAQISAAAQVASDVASFSSSIATLVAGGTLMTQPTSSNANVATASPIPGARIGNLSASVTVTALATAQSINKAVSDFPTSADGSFTITVGATATAIPVPAGTTAAGLAALVNARKLGVTASMVTSGATTTLVLKGGTGAANAFSIAGGGDAALTDLSYTPPATSGGTGTGSMTGTVNASDAVLVVDGVQVTRPSNTIGDAVTGVKLVLTGTGTISLGATRPTDAITGAVSNFVDYYNALKTEIDGYTAAATTSADAGALRGNATVRALQQQLRKLTTTPLTANGSITTLAQLGVKTAQDGSLSVDGTALAAVLASAPDDVEAMFNPAQSSSNPGVTITSGFGAVAAGHYALTGITPAANGVSASGTLDGTAMTGLGGTLTAATGSAANGLQLVIGSAASGSATLTLDLGLGGALAMLKTALVGTNGSLSAFQATLKTQTGTLADALTAADKKLTVYHDRLVSQFSTMNTRVSAYKATQSYLTQQVDLWTKSTN